MTPAQEGARLKATLDGIWAKGDRDECSIKHIGHGLAAIVTGGTWQDAVDYKRPWPSGTGSPSWETDLDGRWAKVQATYDRLGHDEFMAAVDYGPYGEYVQFYADMYYDKAEA